ncbi:MAG: lipopolysaccharide heptosyltransferase II [Caldithrix sp.]|nr:lipopolysaccharide heptosyltransferase II [Caldithrix sp.]
MEYLIMMEHETLPNDTYNKILIIQTAFIGDTILVTPLIRAARHFFPQTQIDIMVIPQTAPLLDNNPHIQHIIRFDKRDQKRKAFVQTLKQLRATNYDLALAPHSSMTSALLMKCSGIPRRIGFNRHFARYLLTDRIDYLANQLEIDRNLQLMSVFTAKPFDRQTELFPLTEDFENVRNMLSKGGQVPIRIGIAPGSVWPTKRWPQSYFITLTDLLDRHNAQCIFIGSRHEQTLCRSIIEKSGAQHAVNLAGKLSLLESAAAIQQCSVVVTNDSGALHIANAMQTDVYAIFGPTVRSFGFFPFRENDVVFENEHLYCRPCAKHGGKKCPEKHFRCMLEIHPKTVFNVLSRNYHLSSNS